MSFTTPLLFALVLLSSSAGSQADAVSPSEHASDDLTALRSTFEARRHAIVSSDSGHVARNPGQRLRARFDGRGFTTTPEGGTWSWGLELESWGVEGREVAIEGEALALAEGQRLTYDWSAELSEWFVNDGRGLEHGYTVHRRPPRDSAEPYAPLSFRLRMRGSLRPEILESGRNVRFANGAGVTALNYSGLVAFDAQGRDLDARFERTGEGLHLLVDERHAEYPLTIDPIIQQVYIKAATPGAGDFLGFSVAISGDTAVVGAIGEDSSATGVNGDESLNDAQESGAAYVFVRSGTTWTQEAYLKASNTGAGDWFGYDVDISGNAIVVSARREDSNATGVNGDGTNDDANDSGAAYVFQRNGTTWTQEAYLKASNTEANDVFGDDVSLDQDTIVVGAAYEDSNSTGIGGNSANNSATAAGAAYVFLRTGTTWAQQAYIKASNAQALDLFGDAVDIDKNSLVIGATGEGSSATGVNGNQANNGAPSSGAVYVFHRNGALWTQQAYLKPSNTGASDAFGWSLSIVKNTLAVGAIAESSSATGVNGDGSDNSAPAAGAAYAFQRTGTVWSQEGYLKASNTDAGDKFGDRVEVMGSTIVVVASAEDSLSSGVGGSEGNDGTNAGAAYVFSRTGTVWSQAAYVKASNPDDVDVFGSSLGITSGTFIVGAAAEDSSAAGINGNQSLNDGLNSGAVYVFTYGNLATATHRNVVGNPSSYTATAPVLGTAWTATVDLTTTGHDNAVLLGRVAPATIPLGGGQTLLISGPTVFSFPPEPGPMAIFSTLVPPDPSLCGITVYTQAAHLGGVVPFVLSNAMDLEAGG